jgi:hypothetical protein
MQMCLAQWIQQQYIACLLNVNIFITSTKITGPAEIISAQSSALIYLSVMPMCPVMCVAQWIQRYLLNVNVFHTGPKITALAEITSAQSPALIYLSVMPMRPAMCPAQCIQQQYIAYLLNVNIFITSTKITALAEITLAQSPALICVSVMPMHLAMCPAQCIQQQYIACLLNINIFHTGTKITAPAEITSAQSLALKYVSVMPVRPAQWLQLENIACLLSIVFRTVLAASGKWVVT